MTEVWQTEVILLCLSLTPCHTAVDSTASALPLSGGRVLSAGVGPFLGQSHCPCPGLAVGSSWVGHCSSPAGCFPGSNRAVVD